MRIAFLGLGKMGSAVARHLLKSGHELTVWNRTAAHAEPLKKLGAKVAGSASEAVAYSEVAFTMVMDDAALENVMFTANALKAMSPEGIHVSLSTISVKLSDRLTETHRAAGGHFVAAPVFGRPNVAEEGRLWTTAAGEPQAIAKIRPLLETFSRGVTIVSEKPSSAHALKLGGNFLITAMIASLSEGLVYAEALGIEPRIFLETINSALFQSPFYQNYGKIMLDPPEQAGGTIALGEKDILLFREAAKSAGVATPLADTFEEHLQRAIDAGMKDQDWAAGYYLLTQSMTRSAP
ncbi:MAG TPA: NAD(P)-dependent oxidoreductase [Silvibacterium sp.]|jgi:3-hydroxyisobutyrate dehydrogenase-like beta-hydroxyacid dehydrogenase|nr:NAD(P)-dependent oxidoreductase [Silvibacterium sp.]